jgi:exonuclease III
MRPGVTCVLRISRYVWWNSDGRAIHASREGLRISCTAVSLRVWKRAHGRW